MAKAGPTADDIKPTDRYIVPGLARGLQVLRAFTPERPHLTLGDIAQVLNTTRSAAFRTVYTLTSMGCLLHDERHASYALGPAVLTLSYGYVTARELVEVAQPSLERLRDDSGWSAHLGILDGTSVLYVLRAPSMQGTSSIVHVGSRLPARSTTLGRVLLAGLPEDKVTALYRHDAMMSGAPPRLGPVLKQWKRDQNQPTIRHVGTFEADIVSIAAPLRDATGASVAAISLSAHADATAAERLDDLAEPMIIKAADQISTLLGWRKPA